MGESIFHYETVYDKVHYICYFLVDMCGRKKKLQNKVGPQKNFINYRIVAYFIVNVMFVTQCIL